MPPTNKPTTAAADSFSERDLREVMRGCQDQIGLVHHQLQSYNTFIESTLPAIVKENSILVVNSPGGRERVEFLFGDVSVQSPTNKEANGFSTPMTPAKARLRGLSYLSSVFVDIEQRTLRMPPEGAPEEELPVLVARKVYSRRLLCRIPVMVGSSCCYLQQHGDLEGECPYDEGGFFVINGQEKVVISQEKLRTNFPYVFPPRKNQPPVASGMARSLLTCEVRSSHESKLRSTSTLQLHLLEGKHGAPPEIVAVLPYLECPLPLSWLLHLLGWDPVKDAGELERLVLGEATLRANLPRRSPRAAMRMLVRAIASATEMEGSMVTHRDVLDALGRAGTHEDDADRRERYLRYICCSETLPHMGVDDSPETQRAKRVYLCHMISKLVAVLMGLTDHDDRDHYANKRIDTAGPLIAHLFRQLYRSFLKSLQSQIQKLVTAGKFVDLLDNKLLNHKRISGGFKMAFGTGNWGTPKIAGGAGSAVGSQVGITQQLSRHTAISHISHARRLNTPLHKEGRNPRPRQLSNSAWGVVCPTETPEGIACGLVKNLAWGTRVRGSTPASALIPVVVAHRDLVTPLCEAAAGGGGVMVVVNGAPVGYCRNATVAERLRDALRQCRRDGRLPFDTTVAHIRDPWQSAVRVHADPGCLLRPVIDLARLPQLREVLDRFRDAPYARSELWAALIGEGCIEYIDKDEESTLRIAENLKDAAAGATAATRAEKEEQPFTHAEIHPSVIHGVCASLIPFSNHNQSPRNTYQSAMGKQALGIPAANYPQRLDSVMHVMVSPERPLVATWTDDMTNSRALPAGQNVLVAILCHSGFNQEDSLIMNRSSVEAGMFHSLIYHTFKEESRPNGTDMEALEVPDPNVCTRLKAASYDHLDPETGIARVGSQLQVHDVAIGKTVTTTDTVPKGGGKVKVVRDKSLQVGTSHEGEVDRVVISCNHEGQRTAKVRSHCLRRPQIGDKFCLTPDHDALTLRGWVPIAEVTVHDHVACLDPATQSLAYEPVRETHSFRCAEDEQLYQLEAPQVSLCTTLNHRMWVKRGKGAEAYNFATAQALLEEEGKCCFQKHAPSGLATPQQAAAPLPVADFLELGWGKDVPHHRGLPEWCFDLGPQDSQALLLGLLNTFSSRKGVIWIPREKSRFVDEAQRLALHCGWAVDHEPDPRSGQIRLTLYRNLLEPSVVTGVSSEAVTLVGASPAEGVHCLTVRTGIFYVRRHGRGCWTGNSSRHGQKGIVGMMRDKCDMPFTKEGLTPDLIVNPHAIPSRMTIGHLIETLLGAEAAAAGEFGDGTPFRDLSVEQIADRLEKRGMARYCDTSLICGLTGKELEAEVYFGPTYYQRLKHMVSDKVHARPRGPVTPLTRQPVEGRSREGGLRFGEMERDALLAHGASANVRESLFERSDPFVATVCQKCGLVCDDTSVTGERGKGWCHGCASGDAAVSTPLPYAANLTLREISSLMIAPRLTFEEDGGGSRGAAAAATTNVSQAVRIAQ